MAGSQAKEEMGGDEQDPHTHTNSELLYPFTLFWETAPSVGKAVLSWGLT